MELTVLLTNDDGPDSPLLRPFAHALAAAPWCRELRLVVPARERSWIGKAITRFDPLVVAERRFGDVLGHTVATQGGSAGNPADCVELGLWNLYPDRADLVVSGINMGTNAGRAFALSSGTIGGVLEGALNGVRGIAVSAAIPRDVLEGWSEGGHADANASQWLVLAERASALCGRMVERDIPARAPILSINLPWGTNAATPVRMTGLKPTTYRGLFAPDPVAPSTYRHRFPGFAETPPSAPGNRSRLPTDLDTLERGEISVTAFGELIQAVEDRALADLIERG